MKDSGCKVRVVDLQHLYSDLCEKGKSCDIGGRCFKTVTQSRTSQGPQCVTFSSRRAAGRLESLTWLGGG